jgi:hypothetical protein
MLSDAFARRPLWEDGLGIYLALYISAKSDGKFYSQITGNFQQQHIV